MRTYETGGAGRRVAPGWRAVLLAVAMVPLAPVSPTPAWAVGETLVEVEPDGRLLVSPNLVNPAVVSIVPDLSTIFNPTDARITAPFQGIETRPSDSDCQKLSDTQARCSGFNRYFVKGTSTAGGDRFDLSITTANPGVVQTYSPGFDDTGLDVINTTVPTRETIDGGRGPDEVSYAGRSSAQGGVIVRGGDPSLFNDGKNGSEDALIGIERVRGTNQADTITALFAGTRSASPSILNGIGGNDSLNGGSGEDDLFGGDGDDRLTGREGALAEASPADAGLASQPGGWLAQLPTARADKLDCGAGADTAIADLRDFDFSGCENRQIAAVDEGGILAILNRSLRRRRGGVAVRLHCPRSSKTRCRGRLTISRRGRRLGSARYRVRKGGRRTVRVRVSRARGTVLVRARERDSKGRPKTTEKRLRLR